MSSERVTPANLLAEEQFLGGIMLSQHCREEGVGLVSRTDFYKPSHGIIFDAVRFLYENGEQVDTTTVEDLLDRRGLLELAGGRQGIVNVWNSGSHNVVRLAQIIVDHARLRDIIKLCEYGMDEAYKCPLEPLELIEQLKAELDGMEMPLGKLPDGLWTVEDFLARPKDKRPDWLIRGLLKEMWRVMIVAEEGFGKTTLLHQLALCAARGVHPFLADIEIPVQTTLLVDCENPEDRLDDGFEYIDTELNNLNKHIVPGKAWLWTQPGGINIRSRAGRAKLEAVIAHVQPSIVCAGPVYKTFEPNGDDHATVARSVQAVWDNLRTRYRFALVLENHASKGSGGVRTMDPEGSALWLRWSEFGLKFLRDNKLNGPDDDIYYRAERFRRDRIRNHGWPQGLERAKPGLPWGASWKDEKWREYIRDDATTILPTPPPPTVGMAYPDEDEDDTPF